MVGYSYIPQQHYNTTPEVQHANTSHVYNNYCASTTNCHVDVARNNDSVHIASAIHYSDNGFYYAHHNKSKNYMQRPISNNMHTLNFKATSNIQYTPSHTSAAEQVHMPMNNYQGQTSMVSSVILYETPCANNFSTIQQGVLHVYSSVANSQYLTPSQSMPMNEKIGHADFSYPANHSQASYATQHVTRAEVASTISATHADLNSYNSAPSVIFNPNRINENLATSHAPSYASATNILHTKCNQRFTQYYHIYSCYLCSTLHRS